MEKMKEKDDIATKYSAEPVKIFRSELEKQEELELLGIEGS